MIEGRAGTGKTRHCGMIELTEFRSVRVYLQKKKKNGVLRGNRDDYAGGHHNS